MFKSSSRGRPRPVGLMGQSNSDDNLKTVLIIVSGVGLVGLFILVVFRSQLLATLSDVHHEVDIKSSMVEDLRQHLSETKGQLQSEQRRVQQLTHDNALSTEQSTHTIEGLHEQIRKLEEHLQTHKDTHAGEKGTTEKLQQQLTLEIEECRVDVADLQKDLATVQRSLKKQQTLTLEWKASYDSEFDANAVAQQSLSALRDELRECKASSHSYRGAHHAPHPPATIAEENVPLAQPRARRALSPEEHAIHTGEANTVSPPGEPEGPRM